MNPTALLTMRKKDIIVYNSEDLHAKVFAFDDVAYIGSTNASWLSSHSLIEALYATTDKVEIEEARSFVKSLCVKPVSAQHLVYLQSIYLPPRPGDISAGGSVQAPTTLLMQLTNEQGSSRMTQVQPPKGVWMDFFRINPIGRSRPNLFLRCLDHVGAAYFERKVSGKDHVGTVEIPEAIPGAVLQMTRVADKVYDYRVISPGTPAFAKIDAVLRRSANVHQASRGRKWTIVD